ncbi:post-GPI attachment to proteins factor 3 [Pieris brassicae]|uniref:post-GPI attachment to proteins factor 3 n=1 Tax=Pieris brassicae TaxID=7116 RepID=UPI001E66053D|nr:post-GPI attachment to proteins factor 3 [Pieris brassicae]
MWFTMILFLSISKFVLCSDGDRSPFYNKCLKNCNNENCTKENQFKPHAAALQDIWSKISWWTCDDECRYNCMWKTVQGFEERGFNTPKFHGKWPFRKIMGVQEPASTFASFLNLAVHASMYQEIIKQFPIKTTPIVLFWHAFAIVCMNAWMWSTIFHTKDNYFTEFMDYACALSMVIMLFVAAVLRVFHKRRKLSAVALLATVVYFVEHVRYLYTGRIDYDYNMLVNICFGVAGSVIWLLWAGIQYISGRRECWRLVAFTLSSGAALTLELLDFPPLYGWDAHALWHLATVPLPVLFYRFVIDDLNYLKSNYLKSEKSSLKLA